MKRFFSFILILLFLVLVKPVSALTADSCELLDDSGNKITKTEVGKYIVYKVKMKSVGPAEQATFQVGEKKTQVKIISQKVGPINPGDTFEKKVFINTEGEYYVDLVDPISVSCIKSFIAINPRAGNNQAASANPPNNTPNSGYSASNTVTQFPSDFLTSIREILSGDKQVQQYKTLGDFVTALLNVFFLIAGFLMLIWFAWGVFQYIFAGGKKEDLAKARSRMTWAIVGFLITAISFAISQYIQTIIPTRIKSGVTKVTRTCTLKEASACNRGNEVCQVEQDNNAYCITLSETNYGSKRPAK